MNLSSSIPLGDQGEAFTLNEPDLRMAINVRGFDWDRFGDGKLVHQRSASSSSL